MEIFAIEDNGRNFHLLRFCPGKSYMIAIWNTFQFLIAISANDLLTLDHRVPDERVI